MREKPNKLSKFWHELKRRKVVRVIIVYASTAFILLQLVSILIEPLHLPQWIMTFFIVLLAIGFPLAIILSWIFDMSSKGIEVTQPLTYQKTSNFKNQITEDKINKSIPGFISEQNIIKNDNTLFVARDNELSMLKRGLDKSYIEKGQVCFITGEAGSGKTTLVNEFIIESQITNNELIVLYGKCDAHTGIGNPYLPFREMFSLLLCEIETKWEAGAITSDHAKRLYDFFPVATDILVTEGKNLIGSFVPKETLIRRIKEYSKGNSKNSDLNISRIESITEEKDIQSINQNDLFEQFLIIVQSMSKKKPLLLILDDLHWADIGSVNLLSILGQRIKQNRIMVIGAYRSAEVALGRGKKKHPLETVLNELKRIYGNILFELDIVDGKLFIDNLIDAEPNNLSIEFRKTMLQQTKGHPLYTVELIKEMQEKELLVKDKNGYWTESEFLKWDAIPARIEAIIGERLIRLTKELKKVLTLACIMGEEFIAEVVAKQSNIDIKEIIRILSSDLDKRHQLVNAKGIKRLNGYRLSFYQFRNVLFQKHLYNSLDDVERAFLHEETGNLLEELYKENIDEVAIQLAWHFLQAGIIEKAIIYQNKAAFRAKTIYANDDAIEHFKTTLELIDEDNSLAESVQYIKLKAEVFEETGKLYALKSFNKEARNSFLKALSFINENKIIWQCRLHREIATSYMNQKQFKKSLDEYNKAKSLLGENAFEPVKNWWYEKIEIENERMWLFYWQAQIDNMGNSAEQISPFIEKYGKPEQCARFFNGLTLLNYRKFRYRISDETIEFSRSALKASIDSENSDSIFMSHFLLGFTLLWYGNLEEAGIHLKISLDLAEKTGDKANHSRCLTYLTVTYRRLNNLEEVMELIPVCLSVSKAANMEEYIGTGYANKAWAEMKNGNPKQAISDGIKALTIYDNLPEKFASKTVEWVALLPLINVYDEQDKLNESIQYVRRLTEPGLMLLDGDIVNYAEKAIEEWDSDNMETAINYIRQINILAKEHHYV